MAFFRNKYHYCPNYLPGDKRLEDTVASMIMVDHAGECGAVAIYNGQIKGTTCLQDKDLLVHMLEQEISHKQYFEERLAEHHCKPSILNAIWYPLGWSMGFITAKAGIKYAMCCTEAVEEVISKHYMMQHEALSTIHGYTDLANKIEQFRLEELEHHGIATKHIESHGITYNILLGAIKLITKSAIYLSKRV